LAAMTPRRYLVSLCRSGLSVFLSLSFCLSLLKLATSSLISLPSLSHTPSFSFSLSLSLFRARALSLSFSPSFSLSLSLFLFQFRSRLSFVSLSLNSRSLCLCLSVSFSLFSSKAGRDISFGTVAAVTLVATMSTPRRYLVSLCLSSFLLSFFLYSFLSLCLSFFLLSFSLSSVCLSLSLFRSFALSLFCR